MKPASEMIEGPDAFDRFKSALKAMLTVPKSALPLALSSNLRHIKKQGLANHRTGASTVSSLAYSYSPNQLLVIELYDHYRTCLMNAKFYSNRLRWYKIINTWADIIVALATSSGFAGLAIWSNPIGANIPSVLLAASTIISALRPIFRLSDKIDQYGKMHYGYLELYYRFDSLISLMRSNRTVTDEHKQKAIDLADRFRAMELEGDAYQDPKKLLSIQDEVDQAIPSDQLWLPQE